MTAYREYKQVLQNIVDAEEMIKEFWWWCGLGGNGHKQGLKDAKGEKEEYEEKLKIFYPKIQMMIKTLSFEIVVAEDQRQLFAGDSL